MKPNDFYPIINMPLCARCGEPIDPEAPRVAAVWDGDKLIGVAHEGCT